MNLYKTNPSLTFLDVVADFILSNFNNKQSIHQLKVILPNGFTCLHLQQILVKKQGITVLPNIIPFENIIAEDIAIFKLPSKKLVSITTLEEKIILTKIISNYPKLQFSVTESLQFCSSLAQLFYELICNNIPIESIATLGALNQSDYWHSIFVFLQYIYEEWQINIKSLRKQDRAHYKMNMLEAEMERVQKKGANLIVAGIVGHDIISWNFLQNIAKSPSTSIILPPISDLPDFLLQDNTKYENDGLYCLKQLLKVLDKNLSDFKVLGDKSQASILDKLIINHKNLSLQNDDKLNNNFTKELISNLTYIELENIYQEAEQISVICQQYFDKKIAIIVNDQKAKEFYCNFLMKYSLEFQDLLGNNLLQTHIGHLMVAISEILCNEFDLRKLFVLLKNPLINTARMVDQPNANLVHKLEMLMLGKNRFISNSDQMLAIIKQTTDNELIEWCQNLIKLLYKNQDKSFIQILKSTIYIAEKLCVNIWYEQLATEISKIFTELITLNYNFILENKADFSKILRSLISSYKYFNNKNYSANIIIGTVEDLVLVKFDLVILANCSEGNWPPAFSVNPWLNKQMQEELCLTLTQARSSTSLYHFYLLLHNDQVIITRSKKQDSNSRLQASNYMLKLQFILGNSLLGQHESKGAMISTNNIISNNIKTNSVHSHFFPSTLSVTDIEILIRNPYSFYAKKILNLKRKDMIGAGPKISAFGSFVHNVLEQYTKNYNKIGQDNQCVSNRIQHILNISTNILRNSLVPIYTQKIWQMQLQPIAKAFIEFDESRRNHTKYVYSELKGEMILNIVGQELKIFGVADRIEVDAKQRAVILDYKTGTIPSKKDIESGLSPQLIIIALILLAGGFGIEIHDLKQIIYVKISNSPPYVKTIEIKLTKEELNDHQTGMIALLEYYVTNKNFSHEINLLKYNDYVHLSRQA